jgi:RimJ/RimL family protein N-acetyltransferase
MQIIKKSVKSENGSQYFIRRVAGSDAGRIIECIDQVGAEKQHIVIERFGQPEEREKAYIENLNPENLLYIVAEHEGSIVGMLTLEREKYIKLRHTALLGMIIIKAHRNVGLGSALMETGVEWAVTKGIEKICLSCFSTNNAAIALYKKFGFIEEGRRKYQFKINGDFADEVLMAKWL